MTRILIKRIYDAADAGDGYRLFTDRMWPRGLSKEKISYNEWYKDLAPSAELRKWYHSDKSNHQVEFEQLYMKELLDNPESGQFLDSIDKHPVVTLLTATKDPGHSYLSVFKQFLENNLNK